MDGIHDLGGRQGFGPIGVDVPDDEQFHEPWEARVRGMVNAMATAPDWNIDWFRHCRELIDPADYLTRPYFDQWMQSYCAMMVISGVASVDELARGTAQSPPPDGLRPAMTPEQARTARIGRRAFDAPVDAPPRYSPGDAVRARRGTHSGHTRLPGYVRGHSGRIERHHGAHVLPDLNALGEKRHEHLYTVAFDAAELWPETKGRRETVLLNLWERYLEPAGGR